ncbi:MAG TPA: adenylate/guanylate cyclase domain-containing protein, partial [Flavisolibacter sp.]
ESTLISHLLGDRAFSYLIKDFFREIDSAVSHHGGTIYQYAGDEMLIHWPSSSTKYYEEALNAFEELSASLVSKETKYKKLYGLSPRFKAALHSGKVVVTWVGQSKKEILYQGEVLNVTARITELAKRTGYSLVVSQAFFDGLGLRNKALKYAGNFPVRGLETRLPLYGYTSLSKQKNRWFEVESSQN